MYLNISLLRAASLGGIQFGGISQFEISKRD